MSDLSKLREELAGFRIFVSDQYLHRALRPPERLAKDRLEELMAAMLMLKGAGIKAEHSIQRFRHSINKTRRAKVVRRKK